MQKHKYLFPEKCNDLKIMFGINEEKKIDVRDI